MAATGDTGDTAERDCSEVWGTGCGWEGETSLNADCIPSREGGGFGAPGAVGGGGCTCDQTTGTWTAWLLLLVVVLRRVAGLLLTALVLAPASARAVDAQHLHTTDGGDFPALMDADVGQQWTAAGWVSVNWGRDLVVLYDNPEGGTLLKSVQTLDLGASLNLGGFVRIGFLMPTHTNIVYPGPKDRDLLVGQQVRPRAGDLSLWAALPLTDPDRDHAVNFSLAADVPTGEPRLYLGDSQGGVTASVNWQFRAGPLTALLNLGPRAQRLVDIPGGVWGSRWVYGMGLRAEPGGPLFATAEVFGALPVVPWAPLRVMRPAEALGTLGATAGNAAFSVGGGGGLGRGLGSPSLRVLVLADFRGREPEDRDGDGLLDPVDLCRAEPEDVDGYRDEDGCPEPDNDRDGIDDEEDACPLRPETFNGIDDGDGCPDGATLLGLSVTTADGVFPPEEATVFVGEAGFRVLLDEPLYRPLSYGEVTVRAEAPGLASTSRTLTLDSPERDVVLVLEPVAAEVEPVRPPVLGRTVRFQENSAELLDLEVLQVLFEALARTPEIGLLRIEGHADSVGGPRYNYELSLERAEAVRDWLIAKGIAPERLQAMGSGEARPGEDGGRRVSFQVLVWETR